MHNMLIADKSKNTASKSTTSGMYFGKVGIGAEYNCKYFDGGLSDRRKSSLTVCKKGWWDDGCLHN